MNVDTSSVDAVYTTTTAGRQPSTGASASGSRPQGQHRIGLLGDVLLGKLKGRESNDEITLFKSLGLAVEDVASAHHIYVKALERKMGIAVELGGSRHDD